jgi:hypothetical protein
MEMLRALLSRLFGVSIVRISENSHLERDSLRDLKQVAGMVVRTDSLCVWIDLAGRYAHFDPPLEVRILSSPNKMVFDSLANEDEETMVLYEVEVLAPERLPAGASKCFLDGPSYGPSSLTRPSWWVQMSPAFVDTCVGEDSNTEW